MSRQGIRALLHTTSKGSLSLKTNISSSISIRSCSLLLPSLSQLPLFASSASTSTLQSSILRSFHKSAPLSSSPGVDESSVNNGELKSRVPRKYNNSSPHNRRNDGNRHRGGDGQKRNQNYNHNKRQQSRRDVVFNKPTEPIVEEDGRINFGLITTDWQLKQFLPHIKEAEIVGVDTEFLSFPHYRANLEILQAATPTAIACLDYQALKNKMVPFMEVSFFTLLSLFFYFCVLLSVLRMSSSA